MPRKKKKKDDEFVDFTVQQLVAAPPHIYAVFHDPDDGEWCHYPVICFSVGTASLMSNGKLVDKTGGQVRGMLSNHGGMELVEGAEQLEFVGYWRKDMQPEFAEFLADHDIDCEGRSRSDR